MDANSTNKLMTPFNFGRQTDFPASLIVFTVFRRLFLALCQKMLIEVGSGGFDFLPLSAFINCSLGVYIEGSKPPKV